MASAGPGAALAASLLPGDSRLVPPSEAAAGALSSSGSATLRSEEQSLAGSSRLMLAEEQLAATAAGRLAPGSARDVGASTGLLAGSMAAASLKGDSRWLPAPGELAASGSLSASRTSGASGSLVGIGPSVGLASSGSGPGIQLPVGRPAPLAEELYDDVDDSFDEPGSAQGEHKTGLDQTAGSLVSDLSALGCTRDSLGYSLSASYPSHGAAASFSGGARRPGASASLLATDASLCSFSLSAALSAHLKEQLGETLSFSDSGSSEVASRLDAALAASLSLGPAAPTATAVSERSQNAAVLPGGAGAGGRQPEPGGSPTVPVDRRKIEDFASAVKCAKGLDTQLQGELLNLLQNMPI